MAPTCRQAHRAHARENGSAPTSSLRLGARLPHTLLVFSRARKFHGLPAQRQGGDRSWRSSPAAPQTPSLWWGSNAPKGRRECRAARGGPGPSEPKALHGPALAPPPGALTRLQSDSGASNHLQVCGIGLTKDSMEKPNYMMGASGARRGRGTSRRPGWPAARQPIRGPRRAVRGRGAGRLRLGRVIPGKNAPQMLGAHSALCVWAVKQAWMLGCYSLRRKHGCACMHGSCSVIDKPHSESEHDLFTKETGGARAAQRTGLWPCRGARHRS